MPRTSLPPTPAASTEIAGLEKIHLLDNFVQLPPSALLEHERNTPESGSSVQTSGSSYHPISPPSPSQGYNTSPKLKRTASGSQKNNGLELPPPPSRPRKIIQMKPKESTAPVATTPQTKPHTSPTASKKKAATTNTAAGRKIARKTAHSLIERRRRSKMNEEFDTLKNMIPACDGQDMHKLAILQASIDYVRYLQDCVTDLRNSQDSGTPVPEFKQSNMVLSPNMDRPIPHPHQKNSQPSINAYRSPSNISTATTTPSPAFLPMQSPSSYTLSHQGTNESFRSRPSTSSTQPSPFILPQNANGDMEIERDHEATAALLMLTTDRRGMTQSSHNNQEGDVPRKHGQAMRVKDLLST